MKRERVEQEKHKHKHEDEEPEEDLKAITERVKRIREHIQDILKESE